MKTIWLSLRSSRRKPQIRTISKIYHRRFHWPQTRIHSHRWSTLRAKIINFSNMWFTGMSIIRTHQTSKHLRLCQGKIRISSKWEVRSRSCGSVKNPTVTLVAWASLVHLKIGWTMAVNLGRRSKKAFTEMQSKWSARQICTHKMTWFQWRLQTIMLVINWMNPVTTRVPWFRTGWLRRVWVTSPPFLTFRIFQRPWHHHRRKIREFYRTDPRKNKTILVILVERVVTVLTVDTVAFLSKPSTATIGNKSFR